MALKESISPGVRREGINVSTTNALPGYVDSVVAVESFINESFLSRSAGSFSGICVPQGIRSKWLERVDLDIKLVLVPQLLFGVTFKKGEQPYQDMQQLIKVRNEVVHYKMGYGKPRFLQHLQDRRIAFDLPGEPWVECLSSSEGIRWAHNTACKTIRKMVTFLPSDVEAGPFVHLPQYFAPITESSVAKWFKDQGIDPSK
jgi:hypothetical protein